MSGLARMVILLAFFAAGGATGIKWQVGLQARADLNAAELRASDERQQRLLGDKVSVKHTVALATINQKLGDAREHIANLSGRECFDSGTVSMLNAISGESVSAAASEPTGTPNAASSGGGIRFATEYDAASAIAICRARYAEVSSQVNRILDIESERHQKN